MFDGFLEGLSALSDSDLMLLSEGCLPWCVGASVQHSFRLVSASGAKKSCQHSLAGLLSDL